MKTQLVLVICLLSACRIEVPTGRYGETFSDYLYAHWEFEDVDRGMDLLFGRLHALSDAPPVAPELVKLGMYFNAEADPHLDGKPRDGYLSPTSWGGIMVRWVPGVCVADTVLLHEVTHLALCRLGNCDPAHTYKRWFAAADEATVEWRAEVCR
jgi:hypothetical protein